jgi:hypothetical protein
MQWEYYRLATVESCLDEALHDLGIEGWELVSIMPESRLFHGFQCLLKRPFTGVETKRCNKPPIPQMINQYLTVR